MDTIVAWAKLNNFGVYGHTLVWHSQNPGWLTHSSILDPLTGISDISEAHLDRLMREHIEAIIGRYCDPARTFQYNGTSVPLSGVVYAYDAVNEAVRQDGQGLEAGSLSGLRNPWYYVGNWEADGNYDDQLTGDNYVSRAFRYADAAVAQHCAHQPTQLFYNDGFAPAPTAGLYLNVDKIYTLLDGLDGAMGNGQTAYVDGLGMQAHFSFYPESPSPVWYNLADIPATLNRFTNGLGLQEVKITEADVFIKRWRGTSCGYSTADTRAQDCAVPNATAYFDHPSDPNRSQASLFGRLAAACRDTPNCTGFTSWQLHDAASWQSCFHPLLFHETRAYTPTPCPTVTRTPGGGAPATPTPRRSPTRTRTATPRRTPLAAQPILPLIAKPAYNAVYNSFNVTPAPVAPPPMPPTAVPPPGYPMPPTATPPGGYP